MSYFTGSQPESNLLLLNPETPRPDWFIQEYGGGVMILDGVAGSTFITAGQLPECDDLEFVSRAMNGE